MIADFPLMSMWVAAGPTEHEVLAAGRSCGLSIVIVHMPRTIKLPAGVAGFGIRLPARATSAQRRCIATKVPSARNGFISEPPEAGRE
jgi:hypothetical protein